MNPGAHITATVTRIYLNSLVPWLITEELENPMIICELIIFIKANTMDLPFNRGIEIKFYYCLRGDIIILNGFSDESLLLILTVAVLIPFVVGLN